MGENIENFFRDGESNITQYFTREDFFGGNIYVNVRYEQGKAVLSIGDEETGENIQIKTVKTDKEIREFIRQICFPTIKLR